MSIDTITRRMVAELIFRNSADMTVAIAKLTELGFTSRALDWADSEGTSKGCMLAFIDYDAALRASSLTGSTSSPSTSTVT
jgi:hypothetical protein